MWLKNGILGNGIKYKQIDDESSAMGYSTICHRKTHKFAQDAFFNKDALRKRSPQAAPHSAGM